MRLFVRKLSQAQNLSKTLAFLFPGPPPGGPWGALGIPGGSSLGGSGPPPWGAMGPPGGHGRQPFGPEGVGQLGQGAWVRQVSVGQRPDPRNLAFFLKPLC